MTSKLSTTTEKILQMADFPPAHPGDVLREDFLKPFELSQYALAKAIGVPQIRVNQIVNCKRATTPDTALRLARYFGTSAEFWIGMQANYDLEMARDQGQRQSDHLRCAAWCSGIGDRCLSEQSKTGIKTPQVNVGILAVNDGFYAAVPPPSARAARAARAE